jgi:CDP-paratose 2-epimerase
MTRERVLITGGAGFIGSNLANRLLRVGHEVVILDNLSRPGCRSNLAWLRETHGTDACRLIEADVTDFDRVRLAVTGAGRIYHLAGQVAVTTSVARPREDFLVNALGTFNVLEAARLEGNDPIVIYASTNKVYGGMEQVRVVEGETRYEYVDLPWGISESQPLDFHSPYGCSKGAGDQYVRDYARIYGLRTVVARQSCIYGYRQFGIEDQGWLVWFMIAAIKGSPISIYGNGKQVRDALFVEDLLDAYDAMVRHIDRSAGRIYNIGGGPGNTISVWSEFGAMLERLTGRAIPVERTGWRPGDQAIYISDIRRAADELAWKPCTSVDEGLRLVFDWVIRHQDLFEHVAPGAGLLVPAG